MRIFRSFANAIAVRWCIALAIFSCLTLNGCFAEDHDRDHGGWHDNDHHDHDEDHDHH